MYYSFKIKNLEVLQSHTGGVGVVGSNPIAPTNIINNLRYIANFSVANSRKLMAILTTERWYSYRCQGVTFLIMRCHFFRCVAT